MMKVTKYGVILSTVILGLCMLNPIDSIAQKNSADIKELLEQRDDQIKDLVGPKGTEYTDEQRSQLKDIINGIVDYRSMAQFALQETYDSLSEEEKVEFIDVFSTVIRNHSLNNLDIYRAEVKYESIEVNEDSALVNTLAQLERVRTPVSYNMHFEADKGEWVVTDIIIDDVSTAGSYRRQFQNIIQKKGYAYLLDTLEKRVSDT